MGDDENSGILNYQSAVQYGHVAVASGQAATKKPKRSKKKSQKKKKKRDLHKIPTSHVFMHIYFPVVHRSPSGKIYTDQNLFDHFVGQVDQDLSMNKYELAGINIQLIKNQSTFVADFKRSLQTEGAIVVFLGHSLFSKTNKTLGLNPDRRKSLAISSAELSRLLKNAKAKIAVLAACASDGCIRKVRGDMVVIATDSGSNLTTLSNQWGLALKSFMDELVFEGGTAGEALEAANARFSKISATDRFVHVGGDLSLSILN